MKKIFGKNGLLSKALGDYEYRSIQETMAREVEAAIGEGRRFALLEGGYYLPDLGRNVLAFCEGFE